MFAKRNLTKVDVVPKKMARWSVPTVSVQIEPSNKTVAQKSEEKRSCSDSISGTAVEKVSKAVQTINSLKTKSFGMLFCRFQVHTYVNI